MLIWPPHPYLTPAVAPCRAHKLHRYRIIYLPAPRLAMRLSHTSLPAASSVRCLTVSLSRWAVPHLIHLLVIRVRRPFFIVSHVVANVPTRLNSGPRVYTLTVLTPPCPILIVSTQSPSHLPLCSSLASFGRCFSHISSVIACTLVPCPRSFLVGLRCVYSPMLHSHFAGSLPFTLLRMLNSTPFFMIQPSSLLLGYLHRPGNIPSPYLN